MTAVSNLKVAEEDMEFFYGRSLIYTIRRHSAGQSDSEAAKIAQDSADKARLIRMALPSA